MYAFKPSFRRGRALWNKHRDQEGGNLKHSETCLDTGDEGLTTGALERNFLVVFVVELLDGQDGYKVFVLADAPDKKIKGALEAAMPARAVFVRKSGMVDDQDIALEPASERLRVCDELLHSGAVFLTTSNVWLSVSMVMMPGLMPANSTAAMSAFRSPSPLPRFGAAAIK
jgi:hypothetical protein